MIRMLTLTTAALVLSACGTHTQLTSGADYLSRYDAPVTATAQAVDLEVREIAAVEPNLRFPARIGIARLLDGRLVSLPADEAESWTTALDALGPGYGEVVPVSPLVSAMVNSSSTYKDPANVVNNIRRAAARQHLDHVLIYEVTDRERFEKNGLSLADVSILGLFVLPSRDVDVRATASAMLVDVRNGYPYGTASTFATKSGISSSYHAGDKKRKLSDRARRLAVTELTHDVGEMFRELRLASAELRLAELE
jgi:hypothetical protein